jgi:diguanylate cyclase (GGDEF)-like protein
MRGRLTISRKFFVVLAVVTPLIVAVALTGVAGLASMRSAFDEVFADNIHVSRVSTTLGANLSAAEEIALQLAGATDPRERYDLNVKLDQRVVPAVDAGLSELQALHAHDPLVERIRVERLVRGWSRFVALRDTGVLASSKVIAGGRSASNSLETQIAALFEPLSAITQTEATFEDTQAATAYADAVHSYNSSRLAILAMALGALGLGIGGMLLLTRNVVPRIKRYSQFATAIGAGDLSSRLAPRGSDELAALGHALDSMVEQREFVEALQVTESEQAARELLKRQIERSIPSSSVVVLNRNNSDDRLEAVTALDEGSTLKTSLRDAKPSSCLAVRHARLHNHNPDQEPLSRCEVCGQTPRRTTCEPLLVGGEVIGAVLVKHDEPLNANETAALRESVAQAAPLLASLGSLALAEYRASTDGLTGLPNKRDVTDTIKRMAAQASRSVTPLSAIALDLDHFKQINDTFGHGRGDNVLAAAGAALSATVRNSDFVGRTGGEEFIVLLPDTDTDNAAIVAEKLRIAIASISVPGVERHLTASLGVASIPQHAGDADQLARSADRALYLAKTNGRNRIEIATAATSHEPDREPIARAEPIKVDGG